MPLAARLRSGRDSRRGIDAVSTPVLNPHMFRAYDIRGLVDKDLTPAITARIGQAYATFMRRQYEVDRIVVGRDNRPSSEALRDGLIDGVRAAGVSVVDIGLAPSPLLYYAAAVWGIDGGVSVTASHNPTQYNGLKLLERRGIPLAPAEIQAVREIAETGDFASGAGALESREVIPQYLDFLQARFSLPRPLRVVVDPGNAVPILTGPAALRRIGCDVSGINMEMDGTFPAHLPDPQDPATMRGLSAAVRAGDADLGLAWDGDGDRLGVVDERGERHDPDAVLALMARDLLSRHPGERVLVDVKMSRVAIEDIRAHGGQPLFGPSGHSLAKRKLRDDGFLLGGEASGHFYFAEDYYGFDDAVFAACLLARILAADERPASAHFATLPHYVTSPEIKLPCPDEMKVAVVERLAAELRQSYPVLEVDGVRIDLSDAWAVVRASNTGPLLTVRFEAQTAERYAAMGEVLWAALRRCPEVTLPGAPPQPPDGREEA